MGARGRLQRQARGRGFESTQEIQWLGEPCQAVPLGQLKGQALGIHPHSWVFCALCCTLHTDMPVLGRDGLSLLFIRAAMPQSRQLLVSLGFMLRVVIGAAAAPHWIVTECE